MKKNIYRIFVIAGCMMLNITLVLVLIKIPHMFPGYSAILVRIFAPIVLIIFGPAALMAMLVIEGFSLPQRHMPLEFIVGLGCFMQWAYIAMNLIVLKFTKKRYSAFYKIGVFFSIILYLLLAFISFAFIRR